VVVGQTTSEKFVYAGAGGLGLGVIVHDEEGAADPAPAGVSTAAIAIEIRTIHIERDLFFDRRMVPSIAAIAGGRPYPRD
jgi:hypothetical protein